MKKTLDVDALLAKNPRVDRDQIKRKPRVPATPVHKSLPTSPYGGKRLVVDERSDIKETALRKPRSYYAPY
jgi:hypothetical protein